MNTTQASTWHNVTQRIAPQAAFLAGLFVVAAAGCGPVYVQDREPYGRYETEPAPYPGGQAPQAVAPQSNAPQSNAPQSHVAVDAQFADLSGYGTWSYTSDYGRVWIPHANRSHGWRPYFYGSWAYTSYGWTWVSDEAWGAGPYHYGRWAWTPHHRWVWVPGYTWAPSWVVWGHGSGHVGWAPMPPNYSHGHGHIHHAYWVYVPAAQVHGHKVQEVVIAAQDVPRVYKETVIIDSQTPIRGHGGETAVYQRGPAREDAERWSGRPVEPRGMDQVPNAQPRAIPADARDPSPRDAGAARPDPRGDPGRSDPGRSDSPRSDPRATRIPDEGSAPGRGAESPRNDRAEPPPPTGRSAYAEPPARAPEPARPEASAPPPAGRGYQRQPAGRGGDSETPASRPGAAAEPSRSSPPVRPNSAYAEPPARSSEPPAYQEPPSRPGVSAPPPAREAPPPSRESPPTRPNAGYEPPSRSAPPPAAPPPSARQPPPPAYSPPPSRAPEPAPTPAPRGRPAPPTPEPTPEPTPAPRGR